MCVNKNKSTNSSYTLKGVSLNREKCPKIELLPNMQFKKETVINQAKVKYRTGSLVIKKNNGYKKKILRYFQWVTFGFSVPF